MQQITNERRDLDRGETLVEVLAAVVILGIAGVAVMTGLMLAVKTSDIHRKETTGGAYVRSFAEAIQDYVQDGNYIPCAGPNAYRITAVTSQIKDLPSNFDIATNFAQEQAKGVGPTGTATSCTAANDPGINLLTLHVASADGRADEKLTIVVRKP
ncbi:type II secretion system protein [Nocardioides sp. QY071]|uniref:type II secretion system protein n=1 Tax=Nocardioides sp. QY071 TaxID=3044187 RepID=UPI00249A3E66|nr:type II secretion system protein [Nocardioides sp. QY071]WGY00239.1 type II secretion system protein [Nocardioides sp. QY071]